MTNDDGAVDHDYDDAAALGADVPEGPTDPMPGGVAFDLVTRQLLFVHERVADDLHEYHEREGFDLLSYKTHPYLPVSEDDAVFECVFIPTSAEGAHKPGNTYDYPEGRLMHVPVEQAWLGGDE